MLYCTYLDTYIDFLRSVPILSCKMLRPHPQFLHERTVTDLFHNSISVTCVLVGHRVINSSLKTVGFRGASICLLVPLGDHD